MRRIVCSTSVIIISEKPTGSAAVATEEGRPSIGIGRPAVMSAKRKPLRISRASSAPSSSEDDEIEDEAGAQRQEVGEDVDREMAAALQGQVGGQHRYPDEQRLGDLVRPDDRVTAIAADGAGEDDGDQDDEQAGGDHALDRAQDVEGA